MNALLDRLGAAGTTIDRRAAVWFAASLALAAGAVFYRLGVPPLLVWDEARLANNALEMSQTGWSLVTTYDGAPDHWNTKPPLLIWAMSLAIRLFGANEWSVRLPSALCAVMLCGLVHAFCAQRLRAPPLGFLAVGLLLSSSTFLGWHGARSGNYDVPLALFTTAYAWAGYVCVEHAGHRGSRWPLLFAVALTLALMTKTVQAAIFLPGLAIYASTQRQVVALLRKPSTYWCVAGAVVCIGYYLARESVDPGYVSSALAYDVFGRYASTLERHAGAWWYYLDQPLVGIGLGCSLLLSLFGRGERRRLGLYLLIVACTYVVVISSAATKLWWYTIPVLPLNVTAIAAAFAELVERAQSDRLAPRWVSLLVVLAATAGAVYVLQRAASGAARLESDLARSDRDQYSEILRSAGLRELGVRRFDVPHPGYESEHASYYVAPALFYVNDLRHRGYAVVLAPPAVVWARGDAPVILCGEQVAEAAKVGWIGPPLVQMQNCGLFPRR